MAGKLSYITVRGVIGAFLERLEGAVVKSWVGAISRLFDSDQDTESYPWLGMVPAMREMTDGHLAKELRQSRVTIANAEYEATLMFLLKDWRRDKTQQIMTRARELGTNSVRHWASLLSTLVINGHAAACYDGQYFYSASHSEGDSGTQRNVYTKTQVPELDTSDTSYPTPAEMVDIIRALIPLYYGYKDDQGEPANEDAAEFIVMAPANMGGALFAACTEPTIMGSAGSFTNPLVSDKKPYRVVPVINPRLTDTTSLFTFRTDGDVSPLIRQEEVPIEADALGPGSEYTRLNKKVLIFVYASRGAGYGRWHYSQKATLG